MSGKKYRIRATSFVTYYSYVDTDDYPRIFNENGETYASTIHDCGEGSGTPDHLHFEVEYPDFDLYDRLFDYGVESVDEDWEFTDIDEISEQEYNEGIEDMIRDTIQRREVNELYNTPIQGG